MCAIEGESGPHINEAVHQLKANLDSLLPRIHVLGKDTAPRHEPLLLTENHGVGGGITRHFPGDSKSSSVIVR